MVIPAPLYVRAASPKFAAVLPGVWVRQQHPSGEELLRQSPCEYTPTNSLRHPRAAASRGIEPRPRAGMPPAPQFPAVRVVSRVYLICEFIWPQLELLLSGAQTAFSSNQLIFHGRC